ncbi:MAG TPA: zinc finger protein [Anaerolineae bacterium]|nr:zinc finger protein [Anaerolineae bacterium]HNU04627.1 zinc finger protein [Anaerolineae bacterium]
MVKKTVGYVDLEWTCPRCGNRNLGVNKKCSSCGAAQPQEVQFEVGAASGTLISDEAKIQQAQSGPDIHCPYCGARNPAGAQRCKVCGGQLEGGQARQVGQVVGALPTGSAEPVKCPTCGALNAASATRCESCGALLPKPQAAPPPAAAAPAKPAGRLPIGLIVVGGILLAVACLAIILLSGGDRGGGTRQQVTGQVTDAAWKRAILVQAMLPVQRQGWEPEIPSGATVGDCQERLYRTLDEPAAGSVEVCGTPYIQDTGTGVGEVVQDCQYQVFENYCSYTVLGWQAIAPIVLSGQGLNPTWPERRLSDQQRESGREEEYVITFQTESGPVQFKVPSLEQYQQFTQGSRWTLEIDGRGRVVGVEAAE